MNDLRIEDRLLLTCARICSDSERAEAIEALVRKDIDWTCLIREANHHGVLPLLYSGLNDTCPETVPGTLLGNLRNEFHANARHNLYFVGKLFELLDLFKIHGIQAAPYKGPVLAASVYGNVAMRQFSDLDIIIHETDFLKAKNLLISQGYRPEIELPTAQETVFLKFQRDYKFFCDGDTGIVELQWRIPPVYFPFYFDTQYLWKHLEPVSIAGREIKTISPEHLILILCIHGLCHCWERLEWVCDVAKLISVRKNILWGKVLNDAGQLGIERIILFGLLLANNLLDAALPEEVSRRAEEDPIIKSLAVMRKENFFLEVSRPLKAFLDSFIHVRMWRRVEDKVRYCLGIAFTPNVKDIMVLKIPPSLFPLYYLVRPIRLTVEYGIGALSSTLNRTFRDEVKANVH